MTTVWQKSQNSAINWDAKVKWVAWMNPIANQELQCGVNDWSTAIHTFRATVSLTRTDLSWPLSSKKTSLWPALFRSPSARALMWRVFPLSSSTWMKYLKDKMLACTERCARCSMVYMLEAEQHLKLLSDLWPIQEQAGVEAVDGSEGGGEILELLEHFGVHGCWHHVLWSDIITMWLAQLLLQSLEVHLRERSAWTALYTRQRFQHLHQTRCVTWLHRIRQGLTPAWEPPCNVV